MRTISNISRRIQKYFADKEQAITLRKQGVNVRGIKYVKPDDAKEVYADYELIPVQGENGLYRVEEKIMADETYRWIQSAEEIPDLTQRELFLSEKNLDIENTRRMYMTADYSVIKQLRRGEEDALREFCALVERGRIKQRIQESGDKVARAVYEEGRRTAPRTTGYIGGLTIDGKRVRRLYNPKDSRAKKVNTSIFESFLQGNKSLRDYYEDYQR